MTRTRECHECPECGADMEWQDEESDVGIAGWECPNCGYSEPGDYPDEL